MKSSDPHRKAQSDPKATNYPSKAAKTRPLGAIAIVTDRDHVGDVEENLQWTGLLYDLAIFRVLAARLNGEDRQFLILILRPRHTFPITAFFAGNLRAMRWHTLRAAAATIDSATMWLRGLDDAAIGIVNGVLGENTVEFLTVVDPELYPTCIRGGE